MEIRVLRYFLAVARENSITRAANSLHVTQPTLSRQLKELEEQLEQKLFIRGNHNISLTHEGVLLRKRAEEIMDMVHKTQDEFKAIGKSVSGNIYIGSGETQAMRQIAQVAKDLQEEYPDIRYHLYSGNADDVMERLDKGMLDFGILIQPVDLSKYNYITLPAKDVWGVVMRCDSPLAKKESITRKDLLDIPLICSRQLTQRTSSKNEYSDWIGDDIDKLNIIATYNLIYNAALMVEQGIGYAISLDKLINLTGNENLCFRRLEPRLESRLDLVWKKHQVFSKAAELFLKRVQGKFSFI